MTAEMPPTPPREAGQDAGDPARTDAARGLRGTIDPLVVLTRIARAAAARTDAAALCSAAIDALLAALAADGASLYVVESDHLVELAGIVVPGSSPSQTRLPLPGSFNAQLLGTPGARAWDIDEAPEPVRRALGYPDETRVASAAIPSRGLSVGLIHVARSGAGAERFSAGELALLATAAAQLGPGLELALRHPGDAAIGRELSVLHRIAAAAGHRLEIDAVAASCVQL